VYRESHVAGVNALLMRRITLQADRPLSPRCRLALSRSCVTSDSPCDGEQGIGPSFRLSCTRARRAVQLRVTEDCAA